jgi:hyperosmotically inducible protein
MNKRIVTLLATLACAFALPLHAKETAGNAIDDSSITTEIKAQLFDNKNTHATKISVTTYLGIVQLSGFVSTDNEKEWAARIAQGVKGVKEVRNSIALHPDTSMGTKLDDTMLTSKVKAALMDSADVKSGDITVISEGGIVQLSGFVPSQGMKDRAVKVTEMVAGVQRVDNALIVKPK